MRLQRLELSGFKSFPDRAELAFDEGVTAIVGPNGCGKSNLVDAITWVLGEQSARSLRGDRMEDVIFGGSDVRKPTAAAEVRLKLSAVASAVPARLFGTGADRRRATGGNGHGTARANRSEDGHSDGASETVAVEAGRAVAPAVPLPGPVTPFLVDDEPVIVRDIEVARRLYRSGESEYLIDGEVCRLRDVHDLLMDAGLGVKGYAVIEQGKIGQILSARPTERRQLIEEAAGVTKYKSRRRTAELKLEAAQQNLTRVDDIIYEVEKQRGTLKRQAARARRYGRLRDELRRWEKVVFAHRYQVLAAAIESAHTHVEAARSRESTAAARLADVETALERRRLDLVEADSRVTSTREAAHAHELAIERRQQQVVFDRQQVAALRTAEADLAVELKALDSKRDPARQELEGRRAAVICVEEERARAAEGLSQEEAAHETAYRELEGLESDVEAARSEVFSALNAATALRHAVDHATTARERIAEEIGRFDAERDDLALEAERASQEQQAAGELLDRAREALEATRLACVAREAGLASAGERHEELARQCRVLEQGRAALAARLASLEELHAARAEYGDAARLVLAESNGTVGQLGSVADYLEVDPRYERAVEAWLGDLLQHVLVRQHDHAAAGLELVRQQDAGRCGFLVVEESLDAAPPPAEPAAPAGLTSMRSVVWVNGPYRDAILSVVGRAWIAETFEQAAATAVAADVPVATLAGEVFRGARLVFGGTKTEARGILATTREIKELRARLAIEEERLAQVNEELAGLAAAISDAEAAIASFQAEAHQQEKAMVGFEARLARAREEADRVSRKQDLVGAERRRADDERQALEARQVEARESIQRLESEQRLADDRFASAQRRLFSAREAVEACGARAAEAKAAHAALVERAAGLAADVGRLEDASRDLEERAAATADERTRALARLAALDEGIVQAERQLDEDVRSFDTLKEQVRAAEEESTSLRERFDALDQQIRVARRDLEAIRGELGQLEIAKVTAEGDLHHLAETCLATVQAGLDEVAAEVARLEEAGELDMSPGVPDGPETDEIEEQHGTSDEPVGEIAAGDAGDGTVAPAPPVPVSPEERVAALRAKIDRLGPVNMMAIDQFDDLENRHTFLTTQRKDLIESIAATGDAIKRIDKTTRERFAEAFRVINENFGATFATLFGGGRAGLVLLDEADELESGIDIIAQPPGKRLQSVQLLSGGEKALTAMALMFALFRFRPSPFCLLDEIDAPLDDANIGRFVAMLQGMQDDTQFVLITHNRKTMEIADRLYGVTMEEPGVSKLISVQVN